MNKESTLQTGASHRVESSPLTCHRCGGFVVPDRVIDLMESQEQMFLNLFRCPQCGDVVDEVILKNQQADHVISPKQPHRRRRSKIQTIHG